MASERHLSVGFAGGGLSSLLFQLLRDWSSHSAPLPVAPDPLPLQIGEVCHCTIFASWDLSERELGILICGILLGLLLLPFIELLLVIRQAWSIWLRQRLLGSAGKPLYRTV